jgi:hypothetical protein
LLAGSKGRKGSKESMHGDKTAWVLASYAFSYLLAVGLYYRTYERLVAPLVPYMAIAAAALLALGSASWRPRFLGRAATALAMLVPLSTATALARLRGRPDTTIQLAGWIEAQSLGKEDLFYLTDGFDVPLFYARDDLGQNRRQLFGARTYPWFRYQDRIDPVSMAEDAQPMRFIPHRDPEFLAAFEADPASALLSLNPRYIAIARFSREDLPWPRSVVREACASLATQVEVFSPCESPTLASSPLAYQDSGVAMRDPIFLRILQARALGPVIEVYRFDPR